MIRLLVKNQYRIVGTLILLTGISLFCWIWLSKINGLPLDRVTVESTVNRVITDKDKICFFLVNNEEEYCLHDSETDIKTLETLIARTPNPKVSLERYWFNSRVKIAYLSVGNRVIMSHEDTLLRQKQWKSDGYLLSLFFCCIGLFSFLLGDKINARYNHSN